MASSVELAPAIAAHLACVAVALTGVELRWRALVAIGKPLATMALWPVAGVPPAPANASTMLVAVGIGLSLVGDVALLGEGSTAFLVGLGAFLAAHLAYVGAFLTCGDARLVPAALALLPVAAATVWLLGHLLGNAAPGMRVPMILYGVAITSMVVSAFATLGSRWPSDAALAAVLGALLFYTSDANLAWNRFVGARRHGQTLTLTLYWSGQLGIALAARWAAPS